MFAGRELLLLALDQEMTNTRRRIRSAIKEHPHLWSNRLNPEATNQNIIKILNTELKEKPINRGIP